MKKSSFLFVVSLLNTIGNVKAFGQKQQEDSKLVDGNVVVRVKSEAGLDTLLNVLSKNGVYVDEFSQVVTHQEQSFIDIKCFNCIINTKHFNNTIQHSDNDIVTTKKYDKNFKILNNSGK